MSSTAFQSIWLRSHLSERRLFLAGYITAMIGPNGAGKSTVINMLSGTLVPSDGSVGIMGRPVVGLRPKDVAQLGLARTYQTPRLFEGLTVLETVMLARDRFGSRAWLTGAALRHWQEYYMPVPKSFCRQAS